MASFAILHRDHSSEAITVNLDYVVTMERQEGYTILRMADAAKGLTSITVKELPEAIILEAKSYRGL